MRHRLYPQAQSSPIRSQSFIALVSMNFLPSATHHRTPELLVSVRCMAEFETAISCQGVDIIDLKEPRQGALSPVSTELWQSAASYAASHSSTTRLSAALGESEQARQCARMLPDHFHFAKMGPSSIGSERLLQQGWETIRRDLPNSVELVAVAYADFIAAQTISPDRVLLLAASMGFRRILIDTFVKDGVSSIDHLGMDGLGAFAKAAQSNHLWWSLAGSIQRNHLSQLNENGIVPNCIWAKRRGVRRRSRE